MIDGGTGAERENTKLITYKKPHPDIKEKPLASKLTIGGIGKKRKKKKEFCQLHAIINVPIKPNPSYYFLRPVTSDLLSHNVVKRTTHLNNIPFVSAAPKLNTLHQSGADFPSQSLL